MKAFKLPNHFLMGSATAATQIEGGDVNSNWYHWSLQGKIARGESSVIAADHYNRYEEDISLMKQMNQKIYRMSIEWSRIEPEEGKWSKDGIEHYLDEINKLHEADIEPLLTLHHFSHPQWFEEKGAWRNPNAPLMFMRFVEVVIREFGHLVSDYCTINEPNVFLNDTYMDGKYPPGKKGDIRSYFKAGKNLILAHLKAYKFIHDTRTDMGYKDTKVGIALHIAYFESDKSVKFSELSKKIAEYSFHQLFLNGMIDGKLSFPLKSIPTPNRYPIGKGRYCDYMGINYYSRHIVTFTPKISQAFVDIHTKVGLTDSNVNDLGWEIYPQGLYKVVKANYERYKLPIYITENGIPDSKDAKRWSFIKSHLYEISKLIDAGIDVQRYYHWSLLDNLEWNDGYLPRFGLIEVNYQTLERIIRPSGIKYGQLCLTKELIKEV